MKKIFVLVVMLMLFSSMYIPFVSSIDDVGDFDEVYSVYDVYCDGTYVYSACGASGLRAYSFDGSTLTFIDDIDDGGTYISVDGDGTYIFCGISGDTYNIRSYSFDGSTLSNEVATNYGDDAWGNTYVNGSLIHTAFIEGAYFEIASFSTSTLTLGDYNRDGGTTQDVTGDGYYVYSVGTFGIRAYTVDGDDNYHLMTEYDESENFNHVDYDDGYIFASSNDDIFVYTYDGSSFTKVDTENVVPANLGDIHATNSRVYATAYNDTSDDVFYYSFNGSGLKYLDSITDEESENIYVNDTYAFVGGWTQRTGINVYSTIVAPTVTTMDEYSNLYSWIYVSGVLVDSGNNENATCWFEWGFNESCISNTTHQNITHGDTFNDFIPTDLGGTLVYYKAVANNTNATSYGTIKSGMSKPKDSVVSVDTVNRTIINISWTSYTNTNNTYINRSTENYPGSTGGTNVYNGTDNYYLDTGLSPGTKYYYGVRSWSKNQTLNSFSSGQGFYNTTTANYLPYFDNITVSPATGTEGITSFTFNVTIKDTDDDPLQDVALVIKSGATEVVNKSMNWTAGTNATGANFSISTTIDSPGTFDYYFYARDNYSYNTSSESSISINPNASFELNFPVFLEVGQYIMADGTLKNSTGDALDDIWVTTKIIDSDDWSTVTNSELDKYIKYGQYTYKFSTSTMTPGKYHIIVNFSYLGTPYTSNWTLYLSDYSGPGHYATNAYFTFYNNNTGVGIDALSFKIYVDNEVPLTSTDRIYGNTYPNTYTGETIYYRVDDYFDNRIYPLDSTYKSVEINEAEQFIDIPIDWHSFSVKNMNHSIVRFKLTNTSRTYTQYIYPYEPFYWNVLTGEYTINLTYYDPIDDSIESYLEENITIDEDKYYWIRGYDLQDIIIEIQLTNTSLNDLIIDVTTNVNVSGSSIDTIVANITTNLDLSENNISSIVYNVWNSLNLTDNDIGYLNTTIYTNFTAIENDIGSMHTSINSSLNLVENNVTAVQLNFWGNVNASLKNRSAVMFSFYNTNDGLGLSWDVLKVYVNGTRITDQIYWCMNGTEINVTIKDYYNFTLYNNTFSISAPYTFLDLGLTFHSWLFGNKNDKYYIISFLKEGGSRWYERGIVPNGEREFLLPSGNYTMRIYDANYVELYNSSHNSSTMNRSMVYVIQGTNLTTVIAGQSVIEGQLLELSTEIDYALMPDANYYSFNPVVIFSCFDKIGQDLGQNVWKVCPAKQLIATTRNETYGNYINSTALVPGNGSISNGTITIDEDKLTISGNGSVSWVNITYTDNGTLLENVTYLHEIYLNGQNITINASCDINVFRETRFNQVKKFYWDIYNSTDNPGYLNQRPGYHVATLPFENVLSTHLYDTYVFIGFSDKTSPDPNTVRVTDITNDGKVLESGEDFKVSESGIEFKILGGISSLATRTLKVEYYREDYDEYTYDEGQIEAGYIEKDVSYKDEFYNYFDFIWQNNRDKTFRGGILITIDFDKIETEIVKNSVIVIDKDNGNQEIDSKYTLVGDNYIRLSSNIVGDVEAGGGRSFGVYYQESILPGVNPRELHLNTVFVYFMGLPISPFSIFFVIGLAIALVGLFLVIVKHKDEDKYRLMILLGVAIIVIFWILQAKGV